MSDILDRILAVKHEEVVAAQAAMPLASSISSPDITSSRVYYP